MKKSYCFISFLLLIGFISNVIDFSITRNNNISCNLQISYCDIHKKNCNDLCDNIPTEESSDESDKSESENKDNELEKELKIFSRSEFVMVFQNSTMLLFGDIKEYFLSHYLEIPLMPPEHFYS